MASSRSTKSRRAAILASCFSFWTAPLGKTVKNSPACCHHAKGQYKDHAAAFLAAAPRSCAESRSSVPLLLLERLARCALGERLHAADTSLSRCTWQTVALAALRPRRFQPLLLPRLNRSFHRCRRLSRCRRLNRSPRRCRRLPPRCSILCRRDRPSVARCRRRRRRPLLRRFRHHRRPLLRVL